ncbi:sigma-70 family RNA polymerase sigma factor [uncultured Aquimarina sp.]|uniref:RNA polymerase sigma factor n=1 Tax=uncultured Aquimarina sp. TaxID=575652 RepID=UPI00260509D9|nr:sigma-70 family RNA polymerase sigma factor [uncultured Aquimarina sp.]
MDTTKNKHIIEGIITGDHQIIKSFYKRNLPIVQKLIFMYNGTIEDVEDIFQESMILLYHKLRYKNLDPFKATINTYFIGICRNLWRNQVRKTKHMERLDFAGNCIKETTDSIEDIITKADQQDLFHKHFNRLNSSKKNMLVMVFEGKSTKDIAYITGYSQGYTRKKRALSKKSLMQLVFQDPLFSELL